MEWRTGLHSLPSAEQPAATGTWPVRRGGRFGSSPTGGPKTRIAVLSSEVDRLCHVCELGHLSGDSFCHSSSMRPTRVIYVENDPALLGILSRLLARRAEIEVLLATASAEDALAFADLGRADVALIDLALGAHQMNGIDLGLALRRANTNLGIVIHSQHPLDQVARRVPESELLGWSTIAKSGQMRIDELCEVLTTTARGLSSRKLDSSVTDHGQLDDMSPRQRTVMGMAATGLSTKEIARRLSSTEGSVRQDLSRAYRILVPEASDADDLRTRAVLAYLKLGNGEER